MKQDYIYEQNRRTIEQLDRINRMIMEARTRITHCTECIVNPHWTWDNVTIQDYRDKIEKHNEAIGRLQKRFHQIKNRLQA